MSIDDIRMNRDLTKSFTLIFEGDIRSFDKNPFMTETPWGKPVGVAMGDLMEENEKLIEEIEHLRAAAEEDRAAWRDHAEYSDR